MFVPNTVQVPTFLVAAACQGTITPDDLVAACAVMLNPGASADVVAANFGVDINAVERVMSWLEQGKVPERVQTPSPPPPQPAPQATTLDQSEQAIEAWGQRLQQMIDERLARPAALREDHIRDLYRMCEGRDDVARALIDIIEQRERRGQIVERPIGFIFGVLRRAASLDAIIASAQEATAQRRTVVTDTLERTLQRVAGKEASNPA